MALVGVGKARSGGKGTGVGPRRKGWSRPVIPEHSSLRRRRRGRQTGTAEDAGDRGTGDQVADQGPRRRAGGRREHTTRIERGGEVEPRSARPGRREGRRGGQEGRQAGGDYGDDGRDNKTTQTVEEEVSDTSEGTMTSTQHLGEWGLSVVATELVEFYVDEGAGACNSLAGAGVTSPPRRSEGTCTT